jgi:hypothetical protein
MADQFVEVKILREEIRQRLKRAAGTNVRVHGIYEDTPYDNRYTLSDLTIYHEFEAPDLTEATNTFKLDKPLLILYVDEETDESGTVDVGQVTVEFQVAVNFAPSGFVDLLGYMELFRVIVNPRDKGFWLSTGLAIRRREIARPVNGSEIKKDLKDRLLIQSVVGYFTLIGAD